MEYSIYDIAQRAGVSKSTVSRVLNAGSVSEKSRQAVLRVLAETGYRPNQSARMLRGAQSYVIGIIPSSADILLATSATTRLAGMMSCLYEHGYSMLFINEAQKPSGEAAPFQFLEQHIVDGLIYMQNAESDQVRRAITQHREIVYTGERILPDKGLRIYMGNYDYSKLLYDHLMERGHRHILTIFNHTRGNILRGRRYEAYVDACQAHGISPDVGSFLSFDETPQKKICEKFLQGPYTALFTDGMEYANSINAAFTQKGLVLGRDFSLVSIERGVEQPAQGTGITTVALPDYEYGLQAARMMLRAIEDPTLEYLDVKLKFELRDRGSVAWLDPD